MSLAIQTLVISEAAILALISTPILQKIIARYSNYFSKSYGMFGVNFGNETELHINKSLSKICGNQPNSILDCLKTDDFWRYHYHYTKMNTIGMFSKNKTPNDTTVVSSFTVGIWSQCYWTMDALNSSKSDSSCIDLTNRANISHTSMWLVSIKTLIWAFASKTLDLTGQSNSSTPKYELKQQYSPIILASKKLKNNNIMLDSNGNI